MVTKNIFARVSFRYETIGFKFKGDPTSQTNIRDTDPEQDVNGARDNYFGGTATVGYPLRPRSLDGESGARAKAFVDGTLVGSPR